MSFLGFTILERKPEMRYLLDEMNPQCYFLFSAYYLSKAFVLYNFGIKL